MTHVPGCDECGNDDGPHHYKGRDLCLDCLEELHPGDPKADEPTRRERATDNGTPGTHTD